MELCRQPSGLCPYMTALYSVRIFPYSNLIVRRESMSKGVSTLADTKIGAQRNVEEIKIGNTTYIVNEYFAASGVTVSEKIKRLLDKETKIKCC